MGLDLVEIIMDVESHFGINIPDEDAEKIKTPNDLIAYVEKQLEISGKTSIPCESQVAFYKIRDVLVKEFGHKRNSISPNALLESFLPNVSKKQYLETLLNRLEIQHGPTVLSTLEGKRLVFYPSVILIISAFFFLIGLYGLPGFVLALCISCFPGYLIYKSTCNKTVLNPSDFTLGNLALLLVAKQNKGSDQKNKEWSKSKIEQDIRAIITQVLGMGNFDNNADFIDDLGAG